MEKNVTNPYRIPADFNPYHSLDAVLGLTNAIHHFITEGPGAEDRVSYPDRAGLEGLLDLLRGNVHALHAYFTAIADCTTLRLPLSDFDFESLHVKHARKDEVNEPAAVYAIR